MLLTLATWQVSFNLGTYGEIFFYSALTIWSASVAALFGGLFIGGTQEGEAYLTWWGVILLALPSPLMTSALWVWSPLWLVSLLEWRL